MKTVLLTGAAGFIGRNMIPLLFSKGYEIHCTYHKKDPLEGYPMATWHYADLLNPVDIAKVFRDVEFTHLMHFAWDVGKGYQDSISNFAWMLAGLHLTKEFSENGGQRAFFAGTSFEDDAITYYGVCKAMLYEACEMYSRIAKFGFAWGKIFIPYGEYEDGNRLIPYVIKSLLNDTSALCSSGEQVRDFMYVKDVASACMAVMDSEFVGSLDIASGAPIQVRSIVDRIGDIMDKPKLIKRGAVPKRKDDVPMIYAHTSSLNNIVGWYPKYSLDEGLMNTINWWRQQNE